MKIRLKNSDWPARLCLADMLQSLSDFGIVYLPARLRPLSGKEVKTYDGGHEFFAGCYGKCSWLLHLQMA